MEQTTVLAIGVGVDMARMKHAMVIAKEGRQASVPILLRSSPSLRHRVQALRVKSFPSVRFGNIAAVGPAMRVGAPEEQDVRCGDFDMVDVTVKGNAEKRNGFTKSKRTTRIVIQRQHSVGDAVMAVNIFRNAKEALVAGKDAAELEFGCAPIGDRTFPCTMSGDHRRRTLRERRHRLGRNFAHSDKKVLHRRLARVSRFHPGKFADELLQPP